MLIYPLSTAVFRPWLPDLNTAPTSAVAGTATGAQTAPC